MVLEIQSTCALGSNAGAVLFDDASAQYLVRHECWAVVVVRVHPQKHVLDGPRGEASVSLTLAEAKQVRDALGAAISAAENGEAPCVVAR